MLIDTLTEIFVVVDDFCIDFIPAWEKILISNGGSLTGGKSKLSLSEAMAIVIAFHSSHFREFKAFYEHLRGSYKRAFPHLVSYSRFVELMQGLAFPLYAFIMANKGEMTGIYFIDSTVLKVCHNKRIRANKVFKDLAKIGKSTMGWFFGFKLHLVINDKGEVISFEVTKGNVDDRNPVENLAEGLLGKIFGDKGYLSKELFERLFKQGLQLITTVKKNMKNKLIPILDKILLRKRSLIETVNDQLKNIAQIEHTRHRSPKNFIVNLLGAISSYIMQPKKPTLGIFRKYGLNPILLAN
jgi:hypothetical protein